MRSYRQRHVRYIIVRTTTTRARTLKAPLSLCMPVPLFAPAAGIMCDVGRVGAAKRRRDRQLRAFHRHEQLTVRIELRSTSEVKSGGRAE